MSIWSAILAPIQRTRQHHAVEHATIHILNRRHPTQRVVGWSTPLWFCVYGNVPIAAVRSAVEEALLRLRRGETELAVHPYCGTNIVTAGVLAGLTAFAAMLPGDDRDRRTRLPLVILLSTLSVLVSRPLGMVVQHRITTDAHALHAARPLVTGKRAGSVPLYWVELRREGG